MRLDAAPAVPQSNNICITKQKEKSTTGVRDCGSNSSTSFNIKRRVYSSVLKSTVGVRDCGSNSSTPFDIKRNVYILRSKNYPLRECGAGALVLHHLI